MTERDLLSQVAAPFEGASSLLAVGLDLASVTEARESLAAFGNRYLRRIFTAGEQADCFRSTDPAPHLAARFAAKEATIKVLSVQDAQPAWTSMEIRRGPGGEPALKLSGEASRLADARGIDFFLVSLSHDGDLAAAIVLGIQNHKEVLGPTNASQS